MDACIVCGEPMAKDTPRTGGDAVFHCCSYRLEGSARTLIDAGQVEAPDAETLEALVEKKRKDPSDYPVVTVDDLEGA